MKRWLDTLRQALEALGDHRLRTALSVLGITIGIAAVMAVGTVSKGGSHIVLSELETFGLNSVWVYRDWAADPPGSRRREGSGLDAADYRAVRDDAEALRLARLTPIVRAFDDEQDVRRGNRAARTDTLGVDVGYTAIVNDRIVAGRALNARDVAARHAVALIASDVLDALFGGASADGTRTAAAAIGETIRISGRRFTVIGVLEGKSRDFLSSIGSAGGQDANDRVLVPYTTLQRVQGSDEIDNLHLEVASFDEAETVAELVRARIQARHPVGYRYTFETMAGYIRTTNRILGGVALVGIVAASISLLVGGMGILNMMGTSVLERTREIGIRKAIGARESDIMRQFLLEAVLISVAGGLLGLALGGAASVVLAEATGFPLIPSIGAVLGALLVSMLVGVLSGYLPARRAARLPPVTALRSD